MIHTFENDQQPGSTRLRIAIADDHPIVRNGLKIELAQHAGIEIVGEAGDGEQIARAVFYLINNFARFSDLATEFFLFGQPGFAEALGIIGARSDKRGRQLDRPVHGLSISCRLTGGSCRLRAL